MPVESQTTDIYKLDENIKFINQENERNNDDVHDVLLY